MQLILSAIVFIVSSSFCDSVSTTILSFPFLCNIYISKVKVLPSNFVVMWIKPFVVIRIEDCCDLYVLRIEFLRDITTIWPTHGCHDHLFIICDFNPSLLLSF